MEPKNEDININAEFKKETDEKPDGKANGKTTQKKQKPGLLQFITMKNKNSIYINTLIPTENK